MPFERERGGDHGTVHHSSWGARALRAGGSLGRVREDLEAVLEAAERRHEVHAVRRGPAALEQIARQLDAYALPLASGLVQLLAHPLGHADARYLVVEKLGVAEGLQRQDADQDRDLGQAVEALAETLPALQL